MGFRKGHSTTMAVSNLVSYINLSLNDNEYVGCTYIDMCKAFDCIKPTILFKKLVLWLMPEYY